MGSRAGFAAWMLVDVGIRHPGPGRKFPNAGPVGGLMHGRNGRGDAGGETGGETGELRTLKLLKLLKLLPSKEAWVTFVSTFPNGN